MTVSREDIRRWIEVTLLDGRAIENDSNLLLTGLVDSIGVMTLVAHLEETTGAPIPPEDVVLENFETVDAMAAYLEQRP